MTNDNFLNSLLHRVFFPMFKLQTNFFGGDATFIDDAGVEFNTLDEAVDYLLNNKPPSEFEWDVRLDGKGSADAWTRYSGQEVTCWKDGKIVQIRDKDGNHKHT